MTTATMTTTVMTIEHRPVMLREALEALAVHPGGTYVDCTVGLGGHAVAILEAASPDGRLLGIDADPEALAVARERLAPFGERATLVEANFLDLAAVAAARGFSQVDGVLFDLGVSSLQLESAGRGFSFQVEAPLDMRFNPRQRRTAAELVNELGAEELARLLWEFGEERQSRRIARALVAQRPLRTTLDLAKAVEQAVGRGWAGRSKTHPATKTFLALRIAVNEELDALVDGVRAAHGLLGFGGHLVVIAFHSLEDRIVKRFLRREASACICPPGIPICRCGHQPTLRLVARRALRPSPGEVAANPRSRSARLRAAQRV